MTSVVRFEEWQEPTGTTAATVDSSGNVSLSGNLSVSGSVTSTGNPQGMTLIGGATFSGSTAIDVYPFNSDYEMYKLTFNGKTSSGNATVNGQCFNSGTGYSTGHYTASHYFEFIATDGAWDNRTNTSSWWFGTFTTTPVTSTFDIYRGATSGHFYGQSLEWGNVRLIVVGGRISAGTFDAIRVTAAAALTGSWNLYGYNHV